MDNYGISAQRMDRNGRSWTMCLLLRICEKVTLAAWPEAGAMLKPASTNQICANQPLTGIEAISAPNGGTARSIDRASVAAACY
jgi:hypothetical protein